MSEDRVWIPDHSWVLDGEGRRCRANSGNGHKSCGKPAVVKMKRHSGLALLGWTWWHYCAEHMYGRRIRDGIVEFDVAAGSPAAERGYIG